MESADEYWLKHPDPSDEELADLCRAWAEYQRQTREQRPWDPPPKPEEVVAEGPGFTLYRRSRTDEDEGADHPLWWAAEAVMDADGEGGLPLLWRVIQCLCEVVDREDDWVICMIGCGPIEDAFFNYGEEAMDLIEPATEYDTVLLDALQNVWWEEPMRPRLDALLERHGRGRPR